MFWSAFVAGKVVENSCSSIKLNDRDSSMTVGNIREASTGRRILASLAASPKKVCFQPRAQNGIMQGNAAKLGRHPILDSFNFLPIGIV